MPGSSTVLEALAGDRVAEQVDRLAQHAFRGEVWDKAVTYCQQAGARAHDRAAFREAVASFEQALQALAHLPEDSDTGGLSIDLRLALEASLAALGEYGRCLTLLGEAATLARAFDDRARLGGILPRMTQALRITGDNDGAMAVGQQALALADEIGESALQGHASYFLGQVYYTIGDFGRAAELLRRSRGGGGPGMLARPGPSRGSGSGTARRVPGMAGTDLERARGLRRGPTPRGGGAPSRHAGRAEGLYRSRPSGYLGVLYLTQGDLEPAIRVFEQGLALCRASGERSELRLIVAGLGYAYALQGRLAEGCALLEEAIRESLSMGCQSCLPGRMAQ